jgi:glyoxylase-like metal-dependent hydrolase (beta-lactamase superfamily II)
VLLSHYHADYISGHNEFKMPIVMGPQALRAINKFKVKEAKDGELLHLGNCKVKVLHTPGHTLESSCYLLKDVHEKDVALFTGDTVFLGDVGRPDLTVSSSITKEDLAGLLFDSVQRLRALPDELRIYPGHGSGSSCGKAIGAGNFCTLGEQMKKNYGFKLTDKKEFIKELTANMPKPPEYFFFDAHTNQTGPTHYNNAFKKAYVGLTIQDFTKFSSIIKTIDTRKEVGAGNNSLT